jgi:feruloyl-CoA synthase
MFYAGAALAQHVRDDLQKLAIETCGERIIFLSSLGSTETAPLAIACSWDSDHAANIGLPAPGVELRLVPNEGKLEARLKGPNITPGYWRRPDLTAAAFDAEGYYLLGDALLFVDRDDPAKGLLFDGRIAEDFKLSTGTWVRVGALRVALLAATAPLVADALLTGHDGDEIGALVFLSLQAARAATGRDDATEPELAADPLVRERLLAGVRAHNRAAGGRAAKVARVLVATSPPDPEAGEITDKGYLVQATLGRTRAAEVKRLHAHEPDPDVLRP